MLFIALVTIHVISCIFLITVVLLQAGKDAGLSGAFGLGGGGQTIFGARAGDVLSKATIACAVVFMTTCILFTRITPSGARSIVATVPEESAPVAAGVPASAPPKAEAPVKPAPAPDEKRPAD